ncbi:MAG: Bug family tripartite tricarboxylate transporter substrate binding protein, partial [Burkholderiaceae bacterium]
MRQAQKRKTLARLAVAAGVALTGLTTATVSMAQAFPSKPVTILVPFAPGGFNDRIARAFAPYLQKQLGQPVTVVNKGGSGALLGHTYLLQQPADGYTIAMSSVNYISTNIGVANAKFKVEDFDVLNLPSSDYSLLATSFDSKWKNMKQVIDALKKDPKSVSIGVQPGSNDLINIMLLLKGAGVDTSKVRIVTFKGGGPTRNAVLGGTVDIGLVGAEGWIALKSRIDALMVFNDERLPDWKDVPNVEEFAKANKFDVEWVPGSQRGWTLAAEVGKKNPAVRAKWIEVI